MKADITKLINLILKPCFLIYFYNLNLIIVIKIQSKKIMLIGHTFNSFLYQNVLCTFEHKNKIKTSTDLK